MLLKTEHFSQQETLATERIARSKEHQEQFLRKVPAGVHNIYRKNQMSLDYPINEVFMDGYLNEEEIPGGFDFDIGFLLDENEFDEGCIPNSFVESEVKVEKEKSKTVKSNKKRKYNPDAAVIAAVTEETLKSLELDPQSKDGKMKKRQIRNRMSAQYHRDRKNAYIAELEKIVANRTEEINKLRDEVNALIAENNTLRSLNSDSSFTHAPMRYTATNFPLMVVSGGNTDADDSDSCSVQSSCGSSSGHISFGMSPAAAGRVNPTAMLTLPSIEELPAFRREIECFSKSFPEGIVTGWQSGQLGGDAADRGSKGRGGLPAFASSSLTRSLTLISMMCVISLMLLNGGSPPPSNLSMFTGAGGGYQQQSNSQYLLALPFVPDSTAEDSRSRRLMAVGESEESNSSLVIKSEAGVHAPEDSYSVSLAHYFSKLMFQGNNDSANSSTVPPVARKHLRSNDMHGGAETNGSSPVRVKAEYKSSSETARPQAELHQSSVMRKDLALPTGFAHESPFPHAQGLYHVPVSRDYSVLAMSSVVLAEGKALFDPLLMRAKGQQPGFRHSSVVKSVVPTSMAAERSDRLHAAGTAMVPSASRENYFSRSEQQPRLLTMSEQSESEQNDAKEKQVFNKILAESDIMTLQLPLSVIQMGSSWDTVGSSSNQQSVDAILSAFNLQRSAFGGSIREEGEDSAEGFKFNETVSSGDATRPTPVIELSCMILGAKLVMPSS